MLETEVGLVAPFAVDGLPPRSVMVIAVAEPYFQCARVIVRSRLWDGANPVDPATLPTPGAILAEMSGDRVGGPAYGAIRPERALASL